DIASRRGCNVTLSAYVWQLLRQWHLVCQPPLLRRFHPKRRPVSNATTPFPESPALVYEAAPQQIGVNFAGFRPLHPSHAPGGSC
uniref:Uncharacterized protein n=1 Tax=Ciona savignyi TaxID=51511 RepID=H2Y5T1_CIOSA